MTNRHVVSLARAASMSMALISAIPPLFIFLFFQRYLVEGIATTGLKG